MIITTSNLLDSYFEKQLAQIEQKLKHTIPRIGSTIPATINSTGQWNDYSYPIDKHIGLGWWTNGFYAGLLWQLNHDTKNIEYRIYAEKIEQKMTQALQIFTYLHHDVGFQFLLTAVTNYTVTKVAKSRVTALHAATLLAGRFNLAGQFIRAWNDNSAEDKRGWAIIDSLMNVRLLYWASKETNDPRFKQIAIAHTNSIQKYSIRADGSAKHIIVFCPNSGQYLHSLAGQGLKHGSTWARGQAWAIYGFTSGYEQTKHRDYLITAQKAANFFISHLRPTNKVPIDFSQPEKDLGEDNSAAAIAASGLISLAQYSSSTKYDYLTAAKQILVRILKERLDLSNSKENLVTECAGSYNKDRNIALIYADYYLVEALLKLLNRNIAIW